MALIEQTDTVIVWRGPRGIVRLSKDDYEVSGGTVRRRRRPEPKPEPPVSNLPPGTVQGR